MDSGVYGDLTLEPQVKVAAMAEIVQELVAAGVARLRYAAWLRERTHSAGLDSHECGALEALGARLRHSANTFLDPADPTVWWH